METNSLQLLVESFGCEVTQMPMKGCKLRVLPCGDTLSDIGIQQLLKHASEPPPVPFITCPVCNDTFDCHAAENFPRNFCLEQLFISLGEEIAIQAR